jgi:hypothetical protein
MTQNQNPPSLFGLINSNRDFSQKNAWGKNQFNSSFPASLCCYLFSRNLKANYLLVNRGKFECCDISINDAFGIDPLGANTYFAFESLHSPFQKYVIGSLPRTDLVIQELDTGKCISDFEIKLTALPDNTTYGFEESQYGSEIVVRPDTIVYLACSIAQGLESSLNNLTDKSIRIQDWSDARQVLPFIPRILESLRNIISSLGKNQTPFLLQPVWKTMGKSPKLAPHCLDVFFWSNAGFTYFITKIADDNPLADKITRQTRTAIWLYKMLHDIVKSGKFDHKKIVDNLSYNTKNDKAFAAAGNVTNLFMKSNRLLKPIITKSEIKNVILDGGQDLLSPERRFDAIIFNSPELFD